MLMRKTVAIAKQVPDVPLYTAADFYMLRIPLLPACTFADVTQVAYYSTDTDVDRLEEYLQRLMVEGTTVLQGLLAQPIVEQALAIASRAMFEGLMRLRQKDGSIAERRHLRAYSRLLRY